MSKIKNAYETLRVWEQLDWFADEQLGNWADPKETAEAFAVRDYYQAVVQEELGITATQFPEFVQWHYDYVWEMTDDEQDAHYGDGWSLESTAQFRYWRQVYRALKPQGLNDAIANLKTVKPSANHSATCSECCAL